MLRHRGVQLILAYSWARPAILVLQVRVEGGMFLFLLFLYFHSWSGCAYMLRHRSVQLIFAYSWARPAILLAGKGRRGDINGSYILANLSSFWVLGNSSTVQENEYLRIF